MSMNNEKTIVLIRDGDQNNAKHIEVIDVENCNNMINSNVEIVNCEAERNDSLNIHCQKMAEGFVPPNVPMDSEAYQQYLKARLHFECAVVASSRDKSIDLRVPSKPDDSSQETSREVRENVAEQSLDESDKVEAADARRSRRRHINRESAQRSRKRKAERISELEARVSKLQEENTNLLKQQVDALQRHNQTLSDNALLIEQVAELRSQVAALEEKVKLCNAHCNPMAGSSTQENDLEQIIPKNRENAASGRQIITNSNIINEVNAPLGHDHHQPSVNCAQITDRNINDIDYFLDVQIDRDLIDKVMRDEPL